MKNDVDFALHLLKFVTKDNIWYSVEQVMKWLYKNYPDDMAFLEAEAARSREAKKNSLGVAVDEFGNKQYDMRDLGIIPPVFGDMISKFFGNPLQDKGEKLKFYRTFFKKYPKLKTIEKI